MAETPAVANEKAISSNSCIPHEEEKVSTPDPVEIGSPLTPVDHLPLSIPKNLPQDNIYSTKMVTVMTLMKYLKTLGMIPMAMHSLCPPLMIVSM